MSDDGFATAGSPLLAEGAAAEEIGAVSRMGEVFPAGHEASLTPYSAATMIYQHAMALYNASYDKGSNKFAMSIEDSLEVATAFFSKALTLEHVVARFGNVAAKMSLVDVFPLIPLAAPTLEGSQLSFS